jgi:DNA-binding GntR family transcriptional regulator
VGIDCTAAWETIQDIKAQMDRVRYLSLPEVSPLDLLIKQHAKILAGLRAHDPSAAEEAMRSHLREILMSLGPIAERNPAWFDADEPERVPLST